MNRWQWAAGVICAGNLAIFLGTAGTADHWVYAASGSAALLLVAAGSYGQPRLRIVNVALAAIAALIAIHLYVPPGNGRYGAILSALSAGDDAQAVADAVAASPWGTQLFEASC